jgi:hypothetical protein
LSVVRIGNASGFYGDRFSAVREMVTGGPIDVVTGDYLAELTMLILGRDRMKDPALGYARTYVRQVDEVLAETLERGIRLVSNAGGLNPHGLAAALRAGAEAKGLRPKIAVVDGDDVLARAADLGWEGALTANAYLGSFGIAAALREGADIVVTGRVTDASLVVGPAAAEHGWGPEDLDAIAGAMAAGHIIECGAQATGGNWSGFAALGGAPTPLGFPIAEVAADGSSILTKHEGTGGAVTVDTVTAQLVYEVGGPAYAGPDAVLHLDSIVLEQDGPDRVRLSGVRGNPPPDSLKVCVNVFGGFRNQVELVLTGLDIEDKAAWVRAQVEAALGDRRPETMEWQLARTDHEDADSTEAASCRLRCVVKDSDGERVGRSFSGAIVELALASYPGFTLTAPPAAGTPFGIYRAGSILAAEVEHRVTHHDGRVEIIAPPTAPAALADPACRDAHEDGGTDGGPPARQEPSETVRMPLGSVAQARSGDKGGDANVGFWISDGPRAAERYAWLRGTLTPELIAGLVPEIEAEAVEVHAFPNLRAVNVVLHGLLGDGVAASTRFDPQAKALAEWLRSRYVDVPAGLIRGE